MAAVAASPTVVKSTIERGGKEKGKATKGGERSGFPVVLRVEREGSISGLGGKGKKEGQLGVTCD